MGSVVNSVLDYIYSDQSSDLSSLSTTKTIIVDMARLLDRTKISFDKLETQFNQFFQACLTIQPASLKKSKPIKVYLNDSNETIKWALDNVFPTNISHPTVINSGTISYLYLEVMIQYNLQTKQVITMSTHQAWSDEVFMKQLTQIDLSQFILETPLTSHNRRSIVKDVLKEISLVFLSCVFPERMVQIGTLPHGRYTSYSDQIVL